MELCEICRKVEHYDAPSGYCSGCDVTYRRPITKGASKQRPRPAQITIEEDEARLTIRYRWFSWKRLIVSFIAYVVLLGIIIGPALTILADFLEIEIIAGLTFVIGALVVAVVSLVCIYFLLEIILNSTVITVTDGELEVRAGPLWPSEKIDQRLSGVQIAQLYCAETREKRKVMENGKEVEKEGVPVFNLVALMKTNKRQAIRLDSFVDLTPELIRFIEQKIEQRLGITNMPVKDEFIGPGKKY